MSTPNLCNDGLPANLTGVTGRRQLSDCCLSDLSAGRLPLRDAPTTGWVRSMADGVHDDNVAVHPTRQRVPDGAAQLHAMAIGVSDDDGVRFQLLDQREQHSDGSPRFGSSVDVQGTACSSQRVVDGRVHECLGASSGGPEPWELRIDTTAVAGFGFARIEGMDDREPGSVDLRQLRCRLDGFRRGG